MNSVQIGLSSWIIQDGNYADFKIGDKEKFALEFYVEDFTKCPQNKPIEFQRIKASRYNVVAEIIHSEENLWIIDFGFKAFHEGPPPEGLSNGDKIEAEIYLGIDPFFYFEGIHGAEGIPKLFYEWEILRIELETTPLIETKPKYFVRDETREGYRDIKQTNAWNDDDGNAHYVLHCIEEE